jgi:hypothetical protein
MHKILARSFWIVIFTLLAACGTVATPATPTDIPTRTPVAPTATLAPTETPQPPIAYTIVTGDTCESIAVAFNISVQELMSSNNLPSSCPLEAGGVLLISSSSVSPTRPSATPSQVPTPLSKFPLDGYVMTFVKDGNLYFQDGDSAPVRLTHVGEKAYRSEISFDNQKILFYRNEGNENNPYSINTDGTDERAVIPNDWLISLEPGTKKDILGFIPNSHQLLFITYLCKSQESGTPCSTKLFIADTDTSEIRILANLGLSFHHLDYKRDIEISPNGKMVTVGTLDGMAIFTLDGKVIRENILPYKPAIGLVYPSLFWLPDSSGLIVALPDRFYDSKAYDNIIAYTVWSYFIDKNVAVQIPMEVPPMASEIEISPDRKWGIYGGFGDAERSLYLGDLTTGLVQIFGEDAQPYFSWSPDSQHFAFGTALQNMSTVDNPYSAINICSYGKWIDASHFTCTIDEKSGPMLRMAEIDGGTIKIYNLGLDRDVVRGSVLIKPK